MQRFLVSRLPAAILVLALAAPQAQAQQINIPGSSGLANFGPGTSLLWGQTFQAPGSTLNDFTFQLRSITPCCSPVFFTANVGTWTPNTVGSVLYTSGIMTGTSELFSFVPYTFNTGGLGLTIGNTYIAFLQVTGGLGSLTAAASSGDVYPNGGQFYSESSDIHTPFASNQGWDLNFVANFSSSVVTPEPATITLLATGLVGILGAGIRRRKKA